MRMDKKEEHFNAKRTESSQLAAQFSLGKLSSLQNTISVTSTGTLTIPLSNLLMAVETPMGDRHQYKAEIIAEQNKTVYLKGSGDDNEEFPFPQYVVQKLVKFPS